MSNTDNFYPSLASAGQDANNTPYASGDDFAAAQKLFGGTANRDNKLNDPNMDAGHSVESVDLHNEAWRQALGVVECSDYAGRQITDLVKLHGKSPPTAEQKSEWWRQTSEQFSRQYGPEAGRQRIEMARQFARRDSTFTRTLDKAGLAGHPQVIQILSEAAWTARAQGRF